MSILNRIVVVVVAIVILIAAVVTTLVAAELSPPDILPHGWFEPQLQWAAAARADGAVSIVVISIIVAVGMVAILLFEIAPMRTPAQLLISSAEDGTTTIDVESVCILAESTGATIRSVRDIECSLKEGTEGLTILCRASVVLGSNIVEVSTELQGRIKEAIEDLTSLPVARVDVRVKHEAVEARKMAVR